MGPLYISKCVKHRRYCCIIFYYLWYLGLISFISFYNVIFADRVMSSYMGSWCLYSVSYALIQKLLASWVHWCLTQYLLCWFSNIWKYGFHIVLHQSLPCSFGDILLNRLLDVLAQSLSVPILKLLALRVHSTSLVSLSVFAMLIQWYLAIQVLDVLSLSYPVSSVLIQ